MADAIRYSNSLAMGLAGDMERRREYYAATEKKPTGANVLDVLSVDLNVRENAVAHHTEQYEQVRTPPYRLIVRRGQEFDLTLHLNRRFEVREDTLVVQMDFGPNATTEKHSRRLLTVRPRDTPFGNNWGARIREIDGAHIEIQIHPSASSPVGEWTFKILTGRKFQGGKVDYYLAYTYPNFIFVIFNPWVKGDGVYMENADERKAYVLEDEGAVFQGAKYGQYLPMPWSFGQFEDVVLYAAMLALRQGRGTRDMLSDAERSDAGFIVRRLTAMVVDNMLQGRWQEPYSNGTKPWEWTGSVEILAQWMNDPASYVKYAQCWVFAGVLTSLCRALGIPCRPVTNVSSAHDTDKTLTIDRVYVKDPVTGEYEKEEHGDSIWNFHVWNEIWCTRTDLAPGFDGWQVCDATPQELSEGRYQCGPMSVTAVRQAHVRENYDGWFVYGEVNADVVSWFYVLDDQAPNGRRLVRTQIDENDVGKVMVTSSTKNPMVPLEITQNYKAKEGDKEERAQIQRAVRSWVNSERQDILDLYNLDQRQMYARDDVFFELADIEMINVGETVHGRLTVRNDSKHKRTIKLHMSVNILRYTGAVSQRVIGFGDEITKVAGETGVEVIDASAAFYGAYLHEHSQMSVDVMAEVKETGQIFSARDTFQIVRPDVVVVAPKQTAVNEPIEVEIVMRNPLATPLTDCKLKLEGAGLTRTVELPIQKIVQGGASIVAKHTIKARRAGDRSLMAVFNSDQLCNLRGTTHLKVTAAATGEQ